VNWHTYSGINYCIVAKASSLTLFGPKMYAGLDALFEELEKEEEEEEELFQVSMIGKLNCA